MTSMWNPRRTGSSGGVFQEEYQRRQPARQTSSMNWQGQAQPQQNPYGSATQYGQPSNQGQRDFGVLTPGQNDFALPRLPNPQQGGYGQVSSNPRPPTGGQRTPTPPGSWGPPEAPDRGVDFSMGDDGQIRDQRYRQPLPSRPETRRPGQAQPQQSPYAGSSPYGQPPVQPQFGGGQGQGPMPPQSYGPPGDREISISPRPGLVAFVENPGMRSARTVYVTPEEAQQRNAADQARPRTPQDAAAEQARRAAEAQQAVAALRPPGPPQSWQPPAVPAGGFGNWGNQMQGRPDPFYMDGADPFGNWGGMDQFLGQRAAFVNNINAHRGQTASQGMAPRPYDFNQMWGQAGNMYQQGWQNPLQGLFG